MPFHGPFAFEILPLWPSYFVSWPSLTLIWNLKQKVWTHVSTCLECWAVRLSCMQNPPGLDCSWRKHVQKSRFATAESAKEAEPAKKLWAAFWRLERARWSQVSALLGLRPGPWQHRLMFGHMEPVSCWGGLIKIHIKKRPTGSNLYFWHWAKMQFRLSLSGWTDWITSTASPANLLAMLSLLRQLALILPSRSRCSGAEAIGLDSNLQNNVLFSLVVFCVFFIFWFVIAIQLRLIVFERGIDALTLNKMGVFTWNMAA